MKFKHLTLSVAIVPIFIFGFAYPPETEKVNLNAMVNDLVVPSSPEAPQVHKITNKSFVVSGNAAENAEVSIVKNGHHFKTILTNAKGEFSFRIPLQLTDTEFEFFIKDDKGNERKKTTVKVGNENRPSKVRIAAPLVKQLPELARGCEVTSLAMLLQHAGVEANKLILAEEVKKDPAKYVVKNGKKYFGNPNTGFVGDMYSYKKPGFGVYNGPIAELANQYLPDRIVNLSGGSFDEVLNYLAAGHPVWVITTSKFDHVSSKYWEAWNTDEGVIFVTKKMHSVLLTGYDENYVYFNDPLDGKKDKKILKEKFIKGWEQFGNQAISYY